MRSLNKLVSLAFLLLAAFTVATFASGRASAAQAGELRNAIEAMKKADRGPFSRLRWFCSDGSVLPPEPYACSERGGGVQHGEYSDATRRIRAAGYPIATLLADLKPADVVAAEGGEQLLKTMLIEQFLIGFDDGWIYRKAQFYRGAIQHEDEERSGQALLEALAAEREWIDDRFLVVREAVRLLPHDHAHVSLDDVRGMAAAIADKDPGFRGLRGKIHGRPDIADAQRVRAYARKDGQANLARDYERLAGAIEQAYETSGLAGILSAASQQTTHRGLRDLLTDLSERAIASSDPGNQLALAARAMAFIRHELALESSAKRRVQMLDTSLELERIAFVAARRLQDTHPEATRRALLQWLRYDADALYGAGLLTSEEHREIVVSLEQIDDEPLRLASYRSELAQLGMAPEWASRQIYFHFGDTIEKFTELEPLAEQYAADRLRGSALLSYDELHAQLALDAQILSAIRHELFGTPVARGLRSLNPGLARGTLFVADHDTPASAFDAHGIYIVPETLPELPPVAGILTRSEGNALSHVQMLARNLGIPNVVINDSVLEQLRPYIGASVVIAASTGGVVRIASDSFEWDNVFRAGEEAERAPLRVNLDKLQLDEPRLYRLKDLRSVHSGRIVGPKAAKLGELMHQFPGHVAPGLVIPFAVYRQLLDFPVAPDRDMSMHAWLKGRYDLLQDMRDRDMALYQDELDKTLDFVRGWFMRVPLPDGFERDLRRAMRDEFGPDGSYGVFVRSDTNVEDLPNFSGAGLNLTVPNVVGFDETLDAIRRVWASPFTVRAFSWRQGLMDAPEHLYASVLLQQGVPAEKSGVLVTKDLDTDDRGIFTVVVNEGVGGGVDGQLAETLKVNVKTGSVRRISSATARQRRVLRTAGGIETLPVRRSAVVLTDDEIRALRRLTLRVPKRVPEFAVQGDARPPAADIEFGFAGGKLWLFQIRPLVESEGANRHRYLNALDAGLRDTAQRLVELDQPPQGNPS